MKNYPPLKITGNPIGGYEDVYSINEPTFDIPNMGHEGMGSVPYYFVIKITPVNTQYLLVHNQTVKGYQASRDGVLKLGISIPKGYRLVDGKSPHDLLMEVYKAMIDNNLHLIPGSLDVHEYNATMCSPEVFERILEQYPFERMPVAHRPMHGQGAALLKTLQTRELMLDANYPEFSGYEEIIVAADGNHPNTVTVPSIPRRPQYRLVVNDIVRSWLTEDPWRAPQHVAPLDDPRCYDVDSVQIDLNVITKNPAAAPPGVEVDTETETIRCRLGVRPKTKTYRIDLEGVDNETTEMSNIVANVDGVTVRLTNQGMLTLSGHQLIAPLTFRYIGDKYILKRYEAANDGYHYRLYLEPKVKPAPMPPLPNDNGGGKKPKDRNVNQKEVKPLRIKVRLYGKVFSGKNDLHKAHLSFSSEYLYREGCCLDTEISFYYHEDCWESQEIMVPTAMLDEEGVYRVVVKTSNYIFQRRVNIKSGLSLNKGPEIVELSYENASEQPFTTRYPKVLPIILMVAMLILGMVGGWLLKTWLPWGDDGPSKATQPPVVTNIDPTAGHQEGNPLDVYTNFGQNETSGTSQIARAQQILTAIATNRDVKFADIIDLHNIVGSWNAAVKAQNQGYVNTAEKYYAIVEYLQSLKNVEPTKRGASIINGFDRKVKDAEGVLSDSHMHQCQIVTEGWTDATKDKGGAAFAKSYVDDMLITSFQDFETIFKPKKEEILSQATAAQQPRQQTRSGQSVQQAQPAQTAPQHNSRRR